MLGKTVVITGSSEGIGKQTALELARLGARIILNGRHADKLKDVRDEIINATGNDGIEYVAADLSSMTEVTKFAEEILTLCPRLDVLINNAGVLIGDRTLTKDGYETTFAINHLSHFMLTNLLIDRLRASAPTRIITVSSQLHRSGTIDFDNLHGERHYNGRSAYCNSKLANVMFSHELSSRLTDSGVTSNSLHPGVIATRLLRQSFGSAGGDELSVGAETPVYLASSDEVASISGKYFQRKRIAETHPDVDNSALRKKLWEVSEKMVERV